ncbi:MAG TPA: TIGR02996 domain-containing protein, partial [Gemmataceae bacterium]|nr:TIGR02996 domain-containing protein [Gemmataceae bacterium]
MADEDAFLRAVVEEPDDDAHRLVYADWLEERGDVRAEFIRLQYELERLDADDLGRRPLEMRQEELRLAHEAEWAKGVRGLATEWGFRRGFVERVTLYYPIFLKRADELFRAAPIRELVFPDFWGPGEDWKSLAGSPYLRRVRALEFPVGVPANGLEALAASPQLAGLRSLALSRFPAGQLAGARSLAETPLLAGLTALTITDSSDTWVDL